MVIGRHLFLQFLCVVVPIFLLLSASGLWLLSQFDLQAERDQLSARVGNLAARTAIALSRYDPAAQPGLSQDLLAPLGADRAIACVELRSSNGDILGRLPPAQGCNPLPTGEPLELAVSADGTLMLHLIFTEQEVTEFATLRRNAALLAILLSFAVALLAASVGFRLTIGRPLQRLLAAIQHHMETGERQPIEQTSRDELGRVIAAFNEMQRQDAQREDQLGRVRDQLAQLNLNLEQRVAERTQALRESEAGLRQLLERFPSSIYVQIDGRIVFANAATVAQSRAALVGNLLSKPSIELFHPTCRPQVLEHRLQMPEPGEAASFSDMTGLRLDGTTFDAEGLATPVIWQGQRAVLVVLFDVTERKQHVEALNAAKERAETANRAKSDFLATISHELRTPMAGVLGMTRLLLGSELSNEQRHQAERVQQSGEALLALLNDILDISKIEAGRLELAPAAFDPHQLLDSVAALLAASAREKGLDFTVVRSDDFPEALVGDAARIRQILFNLAGNAVKFTETGGIKILAEHRPLGGAADAAENLLELRFTISDSGIGIPAAAQDRIFDRFVQVDGSTSRRFGGTGLGLAICKELATMMGGQIGLESAPGQGSTFWFTLRCQSGESAIKPHGGWQAGGKATRDGAMTGTPGSRAPQPGGPPLRILVAEDNLVNQEIAAATLRQCGHQVELAGDGLAALEALQAGAFDLVLMDIHMPRLDGLETTRRIRALPGPLADIPIIALTADTMDGDREKFLAAGLNDHAAKPFEPAELIAAIARCTAGPQQERRPA